ncbi:MAG: hypothetical protein JXN64_13275 [Spirochaetes bacterium]|nr:hypothetical protein [Spirochaetota bacterium]
MAGYKVKKIKEICYHFTRPGGIAEYYGELSTTRKCTTHEEAGDIVCNYFVLKELKRKLARIISINIGREYIA